MLEVTARNFRCFRERQTARLAPLTLLVGDNGTGKTSFLALLRALWEMAFEEREPNFKTPPYDLGSFAEIAHSQGDRGGPASTFEAGFLHENMRSNKGPRRVRFTVHFEAYGAAPRPVRLRAETEEADDDPPARRFLPRCWAEFRIPELGPLSFTVGTPGGEWELRNTDSESPHADWYEALTASPVVREGRHELPSFNYYIRNMWKFSTSGEAFPNVRGENQPAKQEWAALVNLAWLVRSTRDAPFAGAATRAEPRRTYDPDPLTGDAAGGDIPTYLADLAGRNDKAWRSIRKGLEDFGREAGLFDEIRIRTPDGWAGGPFQIQVAKCGPDSVGEPYRNLMDAGYGVSQVLPVVTELLRQERSRMFLLQQPEAHLHPSAEAALGSLFGRVAAAGSQLVVETHSDHLIDRIRTDARDGATDLRPGDVSILYFERDDRDVRIHSLGWDENGNLIGHRGGLPERYREFFRKETRRSLGL
ncbi:AAA family ATPase [Candidatus Palauibacter sp.]|uniref:AAA family ATPase n=1 Tax=Candidatus Palauibacter sp. TaxID=3101350 RepID=UPI003B01D20B